MQLPSNLQSPFHLDYSPTPESGGYSASIQRQFSGASNFPTDEEDNSHRGAAAYCQTLAELNCRVQQSGMQDVSLATPSSTILMSPSDTYSDYPPTPTSVFSHSGAPFDRLPHRIPPLQPPPNLSNGFSSPAFTLDRSVVPPIPSLTDLTRYSQITSTPRSMSSPLARMNNSFLGNQNGNSLMGSIQRAPVTPDSPPFRGTVPLETVLDSEGRHVQVTINAKIYKNLFLTDGKWTCYRRNYFSVSCSFSLIPADSDPPYYVQGSDGTARRIQKFSVGISACVNAQHGETRELVQHTPKRDKESERPPSRVTLQPTQAPPLGFSHHPSFGVATDYGYINGSQSSQPPTSHTYERIQFQKATQNNGKRRAHQQYFHLVVELFAEVSGSGNESELVTIARTTSDPMVVRGRSPSHYKSTRRDSNTKMRTEGSGGGSGACGTDPRRGTYPPPPTMGQAARSHLSLMAFDPNPRNSSHYGRNEYKSLPAFDQSPLSDSPLVSSSSSNFDATVLNDPLDAMSVMKSDSGLYPYSDGTAFVATTAECHQKPHETHSLYRDAMPASDYEAAGAYTSSYSTRPEDTASYGRFDPVQRYLCA